MRGKQRVSPFRSRAPRRFGCQREAAIEFRCSAPRRDGILRLTDRESGECRFTHRSEVDCGSLKGPTGPITRTAAVRRAIKGREPMTKKLVLLLAACLLLGPRMAAAEDTQAVLGGVGKAMGEVNTLQYSGSGAFFSLGQSFTPGEPWPRFGLKSYTRTIDYETPALRDDVVRAEGDPVARGGGLPIPGGQRLTTAVSGTLAWGQLGEGPVNPAPAAVGDRLHQLWITPHGLIKAALKYNATVQAQAEGGKKTTTISFTVPGQFKVKALVNEKNLVEKVESWTPNPVLGNMLTKTVYADYKDFGGVQFPTKITQKQGGSPTLDLTINEVKANAPANIQPPDNVRQAGIKVQADKVAAGVWYLTGGTHHSVLVEMSDHLLVIEGPQDDARATAVIA